MLNRQNQEDYRLEKVKVNYKLIEQTKQMNLFMFYEIHFNFHVHTHKHTHTHIHTSFQRSICVR